MSDAPEVDSDARLRRDLTIQNYPLHEPFVVALKVRVPATEGEWSSVVRDYSCWAAACKACGAAIQKLLPSPSIEQWSPAIKELLAGGDVPKRMPAYWVATGEFLLQVFPKQWWDASPPPPDNEVGNK